MNNTCEDDDISADNKRDMVDTLCRWALLSMCGPGFRCVLHGINRLGFLKVSLSITAEV